MLSTTNSQPVQRTTATTAADADPQILEALTRSRVWTKVLGFAGLLTAAFLAVAAVVIILVGFSEGVERRLVALGVFFAVAAAAVGTLSSLSFRYSHALEHAAQVRNASAVEGALLIHRGVWRSAGIATVVALATNGILFVLIILVPLTDAGSRFPETISNLEELGFAVEGYAREHHRYPRAASVMELKSILEPTFGKELPVVDGFGNKLEYLTECEREWCFGFVLVSRGKDGRQDWPDETLLALTDPADERNPESHLSEPLGKRRSGRGRWDRDVIYGEGRFLRSPAEPDAER